MNEIVLTSFCQVVTDKEKEKIRKYLVEKFDMEILKKTLPRLFPDTVVQEVKCEERTNMNGGKYDEDYCNADDVSAGVGCHC